MPTTSPGLSHKGPTLRFIIALRLENRYQKPDCSPQAGPDQLVRGCAPLRIRTFVLTCAIYRVDDGAAAQPQSSCDQAYSAVSTPLGPARGAQLGLRRNTAHDRAAGRVAWLSEPSFALWLGFPVPGSESRAASERSLAEGLPSDRFSGRLLRGGVTPKSERCAVWVRPLWAALLT